MVAGFVCLNVKNQENQCCRCSSNASMGCTGHTVLHLNLCSLPMGDELLVQQVLLCSPFTFAEPLPKRA